MRSMLPVVAAEVWHYWIGVVLAGGALLAVIAAVIGYFARVQSPKYPRR